MKSIYVGDGKHTVVDDEDFDELSRYSWTTTTSPDGHSYVLNKLGFIHRVIMKPQIGQVVDHIDGDGFNNIRSNLRVCSPTENARNRKLGKDNTSGFKGVMRHKGCSSWVVRIRIGGGKVAYIGSFSSKLEAAKAYDESALRLHGKFAKTNKMMGLYE